MPPEASRLANGKTVGSVARGFRFGTPKELVALANATRSGPGASAWTNDPAERDAPIDGIEGGAVFINGIVKGEPRLLFGGIKKSGYGHELSRHGFREFVNVKTVWVA